MMLVLYMYRLGIQNAPEGSRILFNPNYKIGNERTPHAARRNTSNYHIDSAIPLESCPLKNLFFEPPMFYFVIHLS